MLLKRLEHWDHISFCRLFSRSSSKFCSSGSYWLSKTADGPLYLLLVLSLLAADVADAARFGLLLLVAFSLELPLYLLLKNSIRRARPAQVLTAFTQPHITPSDQFSLPSGHTAGAFVIVVAVACCYPLWLPLALLWGGGIGLSRILLGVHFPLDVLAGAVLGTAAATIGLFLLN
ncbi:phosphatase PAP2 family protein [Rheinheimera muenzenbergensis]|uniref:undecaprenyl-diphosphate phosphatase n=1 Tax=Rheinheimera muenzenbergensis TaxID=1193628 RepID=A0ABU8C2E9_9GAMM